MAPGRYRYACGRRPTPAVGANASYMEAAGAAFSAPGVYFDGTNDYLTDSPSLSSAHSIVVSFWMKPDSAGTGERYFMSTNEGQLNRWKPDFTSDRMEGWVRAASGSQLLDNNTSYGTPIKGAWHHWLFSAWDIDTTTWKRRIYLDDVQVDSSSLSLAASNLPWDTYTGFALGAYQGTGGFKFYGDMAEAFVILNQGAFDLDTEANRRKFIDGSGSGAAPVDLGADGSTPFGVQPEIYCTGTDASDWNNVGSLGAFTINGALADSATPPVLP